MGCRQVVSHRFLIPTCVGSNPTAPATRKVMVSNCAIMKIFAGNSNQELAKQIVEYLGIPLGMSKIEKFQDKETRIKIKESVRGCDTYIIQSTCSPANENLMEMLIMIDALKRASAANITAVIPYYGYARQDKKSASREPITAKLVADLLEQAGATRVMSLDLHAAQIQGFFSIPFDHLHAAPIFTEDIKKRFKIETQDPSRVVIVSPDAGGAERARGYAKRLSVDLAIIDKRRSRPGEAEIMNIIGNVKEKRAIIIDDIIDTAGTLCKAAEAIIREGAMDVFAYVTHAVLSGSSVERINKSNISKVITLNTIPLENEAKNSQSINPISCAHIIGEAIKRAHRHESISTLFS